MSFEVILPSAKASSTSSSFLYITLFSIIGWSITSVSCVTSSIFSVDFVSESITISNGRVPPSPPLNVLSLSLYGVIDG